MSDIAIRAENLSKSYQIAHSTGRSSYRTLQEEIVHLLKRPFSKAERAAQRETFWALKDVSFEVKHGEVLGIIGRNGAGKSTLLKILSRITKPTSGRADIYGRMGSLLEVGTGFHSELTGRENIFLNGAVLGMTRRDIQKRFDEIVAFAETEQFLDTPVKRYSSGMYMRLAFAVAAHLDPEILVVDEVLAVGDAKFQEKCLAKMGDVARGGRTVLIVSHNMGVVRSIAQRGIWLHEGQILFDGDIDQAANQYMAYGPETNLGMVNLSTHKNRLPGMKKLLRGISLRSSNYDLVSNFSQLEDIIVDIDYEAPDDLILQGAGFILHTASGIRVGGFNTYMASSPPYHLPQKGRVTFTLESGQLTPGTYLLTVSLGSHPGAVADKVEMAIGFTVHAADVYKTGYLLTAEDGVAVLTVKTETQELTHA